MAVTRQQYRDTFLLKGTTGTTSVLDGLLLTPYYVDENGVRGAAVPAASIYNDRVAATHPASMQTDTNGYIEFYLETGEYDIKVEDTHVPARIATKYVPFSAMAAGPQSVPANSLPNYGQSLLPPGALLPYAGSGVDPAGFLLCDGRAVSRTTYAPLFAAIGTAYGAGDGSSTFNIPDLRGRTPMGADNMGTAAGTAGRLTVANGNQNARGQTGGAEIIALTAAQLPAHVHNATATSATTGVSVNSVGDHSHVEYIANSGTGSSTGAYVGGSNIGAGPISTFPSGAHSHSTTDPGHTHTLTVNDSGQTRGSGHPNTPPYQVFPYIIKI